MLWQSTSALNFQTHANRIVNMLFWGRDIDLNLF